MSLGGLLTNTGAGMLHQRRDAWTLAGLGLGAFAFTPGAIASDA